MPTHEKGHAPGATGRGQEKESSPDSMCPDHSAGPHDSPEPPHNLEAEARVIGAAFLSSTVLDDVHLAPDDFYDLRHRAIYAAIVDLHSQNRPVDHITVKDALERTGGLESVGGTARLWDLHIGLPTIVGVEDWAQELVAAEHRRSWQAAMARAQRETDPARHTPRSMNGAFYEGAHHE